MCTKCDSNYASVSIDCCSWCIIWKKKLENEVIVVLLFLEFREAINVLKNDVMGEEKKEIRSGAKKTDAFTCHLFRNKIAAPLSRWQ